MHRPGTAVRFDGVPVKERTETDMTRPRMTTGLGAALHAALWVLALTALDASAERVCERPASETGRTCPVEMCITLQDEVEFFCKPNGPGSSPPKCADLPPNDCQGLEEAKEDWRACMNARIEINFACWSGGNSGHRYQVTLESAEITACEVTIALNCGDPCD